MDCELGAHGRSPASCERRPVAFVVGLVQSPNLLWFDVPRFGVPRDRRDVHRVEQPRPRRDQRGEFVVAPLDEAVVVFAAVLVVPRPAFVGGRVRVVRIQLHFSHHPLEKSHTRCDGGSQDHDDGDHDELRVVTLLLVILRIIFCRCAPVVYATSVLSLRERPLFIINVWEHILKCKYGGSLRTTRHHLAVTREYYW